MSRHRGRVFLSYAHKDARRVEGLVLLLEAAGSTVLQDRRFFRAGHHLRRSIEALIDRADMVFVVWSEHASASEWVAFECSYAARQWPDRPLAGVLLDGTPLPSQLASRINVDLMPLPQALHDHRRKLERQGISSPGIAKRLLAELEYRGLRFAGREQRAIVSFIGGGVAGGATVAALLTRWHGVAAPAKIAASTGGAGILAVVVLNLNLAPPAIEDPARDRPPLDSPPRAAIDRSQSTHAPRTPSPGRVRTTASSLPNKLDAKPVPSSASSKMRVRRPSGGAHASPRASRREPGDKPNQAISAAPESPRTVAGSQAGGSGYPGRVVTVTLEPRRPDGSKWDPFQAEGEPDPYIKVDGKSYRAARCTDSYVCTFKIAEEGEVSIEVFDADMVVDDAVGMAVCDSGIRCEAGSVRIFISE